MAIHGKTFQNYLIHVIDQVAASIFLELWLIQFYHRKISRKELVLSIEIISGLMSVVIGGGQIVIVSRQINLDNSQPGGEDCVRTELSITS